MKRFEQHNVSVNQETLYISTPKIALLKEGRASERQDGSWPLLLNFVREQREHISPMLLKDY